MLLVEEISKSFTLQSCGIIIDFLTNSCSGATLYIGSEETETKFYNSIHAAEVRKCVNLHGSL